MAEGKSAGSRGPRHDGRLAAVQFGYQLDAHQGGGSLEDLDEFWELRLSGQQAREYAEQLIYGIHESREQLDARIAPLLEHYTLDRLNPVEREVLRLATWELFHSPDPPPAPVVLDQAIEVARRLGGGDSAAFVNGVLDRLAKS